MEYEFVFLYIQMGIRKEAEHEQWLAALRNNVVFVGSFYLPAAQECSLQSDSKFKAVLRNSIKKRSTIRVSNGETMADL